MKIEYEATFKNIDKEAIRKKLIEAGAVLRKPEFMQKRVVFHLPKGQEKEGAWARVRDEGDKITMSVKQVTNGKIMDQKEICLEVSDFNEAKNFLEFLGCQSKAYQESKRELWEFKDTDITIDEWPFLNPIVEIEAKSEKKVKEASEQLGFDYNQAYFGTIDSIYTEKYNVDEKIVNDHTPLLMFDGKNPFID